MCNEKNVEEQISVIYKSEGFCTERNYSKKKMIKLNLTTLEQQNFCFFYLSIKAKNESSTWGAEGSFSVRNQIEEQLIYKLKNFFPFGDSCFFFSKKKKKYTKIKIIIIFLNILNSKKILLNSMTKIFYCLTTREQMNWGRYLKKFQIKEIKFLKKKKLEITFKKINKDQCYSLHIIDLCYHSGGISPFYITFGLKIKKFSHTSGHYLCSSKDKF